MFGEEAVLGYLTKWHEGQRHVMMIRKRRGIGAGWWNGPGGRVEKGETIWDATQRELTEEIGWCLGRMIKVGELWFAEAGAVIYHVHIMVLDVGHRRMDWVLEQPQNAEEVADARWFVEPDLPWAEMWPSDRLWVPYLYQAGEDGEFVGIVDFYKRGPGAMDWWVSGSRILWEPWEEGE